MKNMTGLGLFVLLTAIAAPALAVHPYIIGGSTSKIGAWPWQGSIQFMFGDLHSCGAAIISEKWIVTAAHCVANSPFAYHLVAGLYNNDDWTVAQPEEYHFHGINKHPEYEWNKNRNDLAVIEMSGLGVNMSNPFVGTIPLAPVSANYEGRECYITGWGATEAGSTEVSPLPMEASVKVITNKACSEAWPGRVFQDHICIGAGKVSTCKGDSGSPLVCKNAVGEWELAGVSSWGAVDCDITKPSVYTRISHFREWIDKEMEQ